MPSAECIIIQEVLSTSEAWNMVGGRLVWEDLLAAYPERLIPLRCTGKRGDSHYLRSVILQVLALAQEAGTLDQRRSERPRRK